MSWIFSKIFGGLDNAGNGFDFWEFIKHTFTNPFVMVSVALAVTYMLGFKVFGEFRAYRKAKDFNHEHLRQKFKFWFFIKINALVDNVLYMCSRRFIMSSIDRSLSVLMTDEAILKATKWIFKGSKGIKSGNYRERVKLANKKFPSSTFEFFSQPALAEDFLEVPIVKSGRIVNGEKVKDYIPVFFSEKNFSGIVRRSFGIFLITWGLMQCLYWPQEMFGYRAGSFHDKAVATIAANQLSTPSAITGDDWNPQKAAATSNQVSDDTQNKAIRDAESIVDHADGYDGILSIFTNGRLTSLIMGLLVGVMYMGALTRKTFEAMRLGYIADTFEESQFGIKKGEVESYLANLAAQNKRSMNFDRDSPFLPFGWSTGLFEERGYIAAQRKNKLIQLSFLDLSQNMLIVGGTGEGKSRTAIIPSAINIFDMFNRYYSANANYAKYFDSRYFKPIVQFDENGKWIGGVNPYKYEEITPPKIQVSLYITDIKADLWKTLRPYAERMHIDKNFLIIGANEKEGEYAVDIMKTMDADKFKAFLESVGSQMDGIDKDFWSKTALNWIKRFADCARLFNRTRQGEEYARVFKVKPWSLAFIFNLVCNDFSGRLLAHCVNAILETIDKEPERLADIVTTEAIESVAALIGEWQNMTAEETKEGVKINMQTLMDGYNNDKIKPFAAGLSENTIEIGETWGSLCAVNLPASEYSNLGKTINIFLKSLHFGEAVWRGQYISSRMVSIHKHFIAKYKDKFVIREAIELMMPDWLDPVYDSTAKDAYLNFVGNCQEILETTSAKPIWPRGSYEKMVDELLKGNTYNYPIDVYQRARELAEEAKQSANDFRALLPRFSEKVVQVADIDPSFFTTKEDDNSEEAKSKRDDLQLYYELQYLSTKLSREHMFFVGDEYQDLISVDKSGVIMTDANFPNISRSLLYKIIVATQTMQVIEDRIGEGPAKNFFYQLRTIMYLSNEDAESTHAYINANMVKGDVFTGKMDGKLKQNGKETINDLYNHYNAYISSMIEKNIDHLQKGLAPCKEYPYTYDVWAKLEPIEVDLDKLEVRHPFSSVLDEDADFLPVPTFKDHWYEGNPIPLYTTSGSIQQGIQNNLKDITNALQQQADKVDNMFKDYKDQKNVDKDKPYFTSNEYGVQGNVKAYFMGKKAGVTFHDQIYLPNPDASGRFKR